MFLVGCPCMQYVFLFYHRINHQQSSSRGAREKCCSVNSFSSFTILENWIQVIKNALILSVCCIKASEVKVYFRKLKTRKKTKHARALKQIL